jgi:hypothetical protein
MSPSGKAEVSTISQSRTGFLACCFLACVRENILHVFKGAVQTQPLNFGSAAARALTQVRRSCCPQTGRHQAGEPWRLGAACRS